MNNECHAYFEIGHIVHGVHPCGESRDEGMRQTFRKSKLKVLTVVPPLASNRPPTRGRNGRSYDTENYCYACWRLTMLQCCFLSSILVTMRASALAAPSHRQPFSRSRALTLPWKAQVLKCVRARHLVKTRGVLKRVRDPSFREK